MSVIPDNALTTRRDHATSPPDIAAPPDAIEVRDWRQLTPDLANRDFHGTVREAAGFTVQVAGIQRQTGTARRWVTVEPPSVGAPLEPEVVRQLAAALSAAADEVEARR